MKSVNKLIRQEDGNDEYMIMCNVCGRRMNKTRQDNALLGVLYSPIYIDFIQIILNHNTNWTLVEL